MIYDKGFDERDQISESNEETLNIDIGVLKLRKLCSQKNINCLENNIMKEIRLIQVMREDMMKEII